MSYNERLNKLIDESGLKLITISQKCKKLGVDVNAAYISILKNSPDKVASDKVSRAIATACGASDPDILIIENYVEKAPEPILNVFRFLKEIIAESVLSFTTNKITDKEKQAIIDSISDMQIADFISNINGEGFTKFKKKGNSTEMQITEEGDGYHFTAKMTEPIAIPVDDNTMAPLIQKGDKINFEILSIRDLKDGDIVYFKEKSNPQKPIIRKCFFFDDEHTVIKMIPISQKAKSITYDDLSKIEILGKVTRIIRSV